VVNSSNLYNDGSNIGVGTTTPTEKLEVAGNVKASGTLISGTVTYPNSHGNANQVLSTTGSGTLTWSTPASGVPYSGAAQAVDLGAFDLTVNGISIGKGTGAVVTNTALGYQALAVNTADGNKNTAFGYQALKSNTTGDANTAFGVQALQANTTGFSNVAIGNLALWKNTDAYHNVGIGESALANTTTGDYNIGIGRGTLTENRLGNNNIGIGSEAGYYLNANSSGTGADNVYIGYQTSRGANKGSSNTAIGSQALNNGAYGNSFTHNYSNNVAVGYSAGTVSLSNNNTFLGASANVDNSTWTNSTAVGYNAIATASNSIQLGNTSVANVKTSGTLTAGTVTYPNTHGSANQVLTTTGSGTLAWSTPSSGGGVPTSGNTAGDMLYWNGSAWVQVPAGTDGQTLTFIGGRPVWSGSLPANTVVNSTTGKIWMDRNLGATRVATSSTDHLAYGSLYQWGRGSDGHELVNWIPGHVGQDGGTGVNGTTSVLSSTDSPGNSNFIISSGLPVDWRSGQNANLWQGVNGINNPCPAGYRIPTRAEWAAEFATWSSQNATGAFASPLKLTMAGQRNDGAGFFFAGQIGYYWTSTTSTTQSQHISIDPSGSYTSSNSSSFRANAYSIRCIRN
jgi:uncharacterized protein (TIGR02145 family)